MSAINKTQETSFHSFYTQLQDDLRQQISLLDFNDASAYSEKDWRNILTAVRVCVISVYSFGPEAQEAVEKRIQEGQWIEGLKAELRESSRFWESRNCQSPTSVAQVDLNERVEQEYTRLMEGTGKVFKSRVQSREKLL